MDQCSEENSGAFFFTSTAPSLLFVMACGTCARWMVFFFLFFFLLERKEGKMKNGDFLK